MNRFLLLIIICMLPSCVTYKQFNKNFNAEQRKGRDPNTNKALIVKVDGERIEGEKMTLPPRPHFTATGKVIKEKLWRAVDGNIVYDKDYIAYQDSSGYYRYFHDVGDSRWYIPRLRFGKINLFFYVSEGLEHGTDVRGPFHVFIFGKDDSKMQTLVYNDFYNAIKDNPPAAQKLKELYADSKISRFHDEENLRNFIEIVELYNK